MTTLSLKIEPNLKQQAQKFANDLGLSLSALLKTLLKNTLRSGRLDLETRPRYNGSPEPGDLVFKNPKDAVAYFKKLADENGTME